MTVNLDEIEKRAKAAQVGPWISCPQDGPKGHCFSAQIFGPDNHSVAIIDATDDPGVATATGTYIATMYPGACLQLIDRISELEAENAKYKKAFPAILHALKIAQASTPCSLYAETLSIVEVIINAQQL